MHWLLLGALWAAEPAVDEEIVVSSRYTPAQARAQVEAVLQDHGYVRRPGLGQRTVYFHPQIWRPRVVLRDDGSWRVRQRLVTVMAVTLHPTTVHGVWDSPRTARSMKARLIQDLEPSLWSWQEAIALDALDRRLEEVRVEARQVCEEGLAPDGTVLATTEERRAWLEAMAARTAQTEAGEAVRRVVEDALEEPPCSL